jgi:hypothetical protein
VKVEGGLFGGGEQEGGEKSTKEGDGEEYDQSILNTYMKTVIVKPIILYN